MKSKIILLNGIMIFLVISTSNIVFANDIVNNISSENQPYSLTRTKIYTRKPITNDNAISSNTIADEQINNKPAIVHWKFVKSFTCAPSFVNYNSSTEVKNDNLVVPRTNDITVYPNPVTNSAAIQYNLPINSNVYIAVYNTLGSKIMDVVSAEQNAGIYNTSINPKNLPDGLYYIYYTAYKHNTVVPMLIMR